MSLTVLTKLAMVRYSMSVKQLSTQKPKDMIEFFTQKPKDYLPVLRCI